MSVLTIKIKEDNIHEIFIYVAIFIFYFLFLYLFSLRVRTYDQIAALN